MKKLGILFLICMALVSCSKEDDPGTGSGSNNGGNTNNPTPSWTDTLSRRWIVDEATHNGAQDNSSTGLVLDIRKDGSYTLVNTGYVGTWEFQNNFTQVLIDKDEPALKTTWTIESITSSLLKIKFKSPFTGGNSAWTLRPQP